MSCCEFISAISAQMICKWTRFPCLSIFLSDKMRQTHLPEPLAHLTLRGSLVVCLSLLTLYCVHSPSLGETIAAPNWQASWHTEVQLLIGAVETWNAAAFRDGILPLTSPFLYSLSGPSCFLMRFPPLFPNLCMGLQGPPSSLLILGC